MGTVLSLSFFSLACLVAVGNVVEAVRAVRRLRRDPEARGYSWVPLATGIFAVVAWLTDDGTLGLWALTPLVLEPLILFPLLTLIRLPFRKRSE